jgi:multisubunit Na+/H+ antiporter MnhF subunit
MKKIPIITRVLIVASAIWFLYWLIEGLTIRRRAVAEDAYYMAVIPLVVFWGVYWIIQGVRQKLEEKGSHNKDA